MTNKYYFELEIKFSESNYEKLLEVLYSSGINKILETEKSIIIYLPENEKKLIQGTLYELKMRYVKEKA